MSFDPIQRQALIELLIYIAAIIAVIILLSYLLNTTFGYSIAFVGDFDDDSDSIAVRDSIYKMKPDLVVAVGDMTYKNDSKFVEWKYRDLFNFRCIIGNHDVQKSDLTERMNRLCGDHWSFLVDNTVFIGLNSEGNLREQFSYYNKVIQNKNITKAIVIIHRPCIIENGVLYSFCNKIIENKPVGMSVDFLSGHWHVSAFTKINGSQLYVTGNGGAFHQSCNKPIFMYCNDVSYGFLLMEIKTSTSKINPVFYDTAGNILYKANKK
jgi:hypothetical protein